MEELDIEKKDINGDIFKISKLQGTLFEQETETMEEWQGMPEYVTDDITPHRQIIVSFRNPEDVREFARLLNLRLTPKCHDTWYPAMAINDTISKGYVDES